MPSRVPTGFSNPLLKPSRSEVQSTWQEPMEMQGPSCTLQVNGVRATSRRCAAVSDAEVDSCVDALERKGSRGIDQVA